ncbi:MAG: hypothetical protein KGJ35_01740 [Patescibacteria group bacterium]|nr:hypothetical protein [Patescibacteria group bacterium]
MSRTNPLKKKRRAASRTLLMYGEGFEDETFLKYLKRLYSRDSGVGVTIRNGKGGHPADVVINAANQPGEFSQRIVILDNDASEADMNLARQEAKKRNITLLENTPCLEALLLAILNDGKSYADKQSAWCKKEFESNHLDSKKRTEIREYEKIFPQTLLNTVRPKIPGLNEIILLMEGKG